MQGPPVYVKVKVLEEESTSVFFMNEEEVKETIEIQPSITQAGDTDEGNISILNKINYLSGPFQKQAYQPLQFVVEGQKVKGDIQRVQGNVLWIKTDQDVKEIEIEKIEDILWRGQSFNTKI
ncbi:hypothetical protein [Sporosarcina saromensis]|uniref:hypothetical protein n=1 Tax=Sporosarcina saromensis TaxID=359365 RepID=UPI00295E88BA|nr:hypothetical protein [Sporosarcina saromensis]